MLAALLWLAASFAFITRQQDMNMSVPMPGMFGLGAAPSADTPVSGGPGQAGQPAERAGPMTMPMNAPVEGAGAKPAASPNAQAGHDQHAANAPPAPAPHSDPHAGHCPFCFTVAFALAAFSVEVLARPQPRAAERGSDLPTAPRPLVGYKRARAPPFWS